MTPDQDMIVSEAELIEQAESFVEAMKGGGCPFCGHEPYEYVDVGVGGRGIPVAVTCCDHGIGLYQHGDEGLSRASGKISEATYIIERLLALRPKEAGQAGAWVLVPREVTVEMSRAGWKAILSLDDETMALGVVDLRANLCWSAMLAAAPPPPASPAAPVGVKPEPLLNAIEHALAAAFDRGIDWADENPNAGSSYRYKAANDHADAAMNDPERELNKALSALTSPPGETAQVEAVASAIWDAIIGIVQPGLREPRPLCIEQAARAALSASSLSAKESPEQLRATHQATNRHVKHGSEYVLIGYGKMQAENWLARAEVVPDRTGVPPRPVLERESADMREVAIYRSVDDGSLWVRPREEFEDGRFIPLSTGGGQ